MFKYLPDRKIDKVVVFYVFSAIFVTTLQFSGNWHSSETLVCSDCHTIHNSQNGLPMRYDGQYEPAPRLLRHASSLSLCLYCHDGGNPNAPDVITPVAYTTDPSGGYFENSGSAPSGKGHNLNSPVPESPPGGTDSLILTCSSCHDPHGTPNYRNLLENTVGTGNTGDVSVSVTQEMLPDGSNPSLVYIPGNVMYKSGMSAWCNDCHQDFHGKSGLEEGTTEPWLRHPQDEQIFGAYGADYSHWSGTISNRVEVESPDDDFIPSADDEVFCLSCHKAHGSDFKSSLIYVDGDAKISTCQQCHHQVYLTTKHGDTNTGVYRIVTEPRGDCEQCHYQHASYDENFTGGPYEYALFTSNDNNLCYTATGAGPCHALNGEYDIYQGQSSYDLSSHATSSLMVWPGPTPRSRMNSESGFCVNCHDPHGVEDVSGLMPALTFQREEQLCLECHDSTGPASTDIRSDTTNLYSHPLNDSGKHSESEDGDPISFGITNRHAECEDCHNPHYAKEDIIPVSPPTASEGIRRVSRIQVSNLSPGTVPLYTYRSPDDQTEAYEYEICFKCHSSWTTLPAGSIDAALLFNDQNPSYHPVENAGKNSNINSGAFIGGWDAAQKMYCSDCHGSDSSALKGPHGSQYQYILKAPYTASSQSRIMTSDELCFLCHNYDTYANSSSGDIVQGYSRWNRPAEAMGHAYHVGQQEQSCYACHDSHGSTERSFLVVFDRTPGLQDFQENVNGGRCFPTCHIDKEYTVNYPR